jgi:hypothetical protein
MKTTKRNAKIVMIASWLFVLVFIYAWNGFPNVGWGIGLFLGLLIAVPFTLNYFLRRE